jgi:hypothetical protein
MSLRRATENDIPAITRALEYLLKHSPAPQMRHASLPVALESILGRMTQGLAYVYEGYFILVEVGAAWYTDKPMLMEDLFIRLYPTNTPVNEAVAMLEVIAQEHGCSIVAVGDTQVGRMVPIYQAQGYKILGTQLMKD